MSLLLPARSPRPIEQQRATLRAIAMNNPKQSHRFFSSSFVVVFAAAQLAACGAVSQYAPVRGLPGEIQWSYRDGLVAARDGQEVATGATWSGLEDALRCVPEADQYASGVSGRATAGGVLRWTGLTAMVGGSAASMALLIDDTENAGTSLAVLGTSLLGGALMWAIGQATTVQADTDAIDAVNAYNDAQASTPECQGLVPVQPKTPRVRLMPDNSTSIP